MPSKNQKKIVKNTLLLYVREILILIVSLYTVRIVLNTLGVEDYGIYNVVAGIVLLLSFLSSSMASATQRFFSFALGREDYEKLKKTFTVNFLIYFIIAILAFMLLETVGLWFVHEMLIVPTDRFESVILIFHFSVFSLIATIFQMTFMAIIIAHEDMQIYTYISIIEAILKLCIVLILIFLPWDKLELFGILTTLVSIITLIIYSSICFVKYSECQFTQFYWDKNLFREILSFTSWTLFGQSTSVMRNQAITILLNQFFNPVVVASRAIAINVANKVNVFSNNFNLGLYPSIIKMYASDNKDEMFSLVFNGSKITFFLMWVFALPMILEMELILNLWLKNPPYQAVLFTQLALVEVIINSMSLPIATAARAPGNMKIYELTLGLIQLSIFFVSWRLIELGGAAYIVFLVAIIVNIIMFIVRLLIVKYLILFSIRSFVKFVLFPVFLVALTSFIPSYTLHILLPKKIIFSCITFLISTIITSFCMYALGLDKIWRNKLRKLIVTRITNNYNYYIHRKIYK